MNFYKITSWDNTNPVFIGDLLIDVIKNYARKRARKEGSLVKVKNMLTTEGFKISPDGHQSKTYFVD